MSIQWSHIIAAVQSFNIDYDTKSTTGEIPLTGHHTIPDSVLRNSFALKVLQVWRLYDGGLFVPGVTTSLPTVDKIGHNDLWENLIRLPNIEEDGVRLGITAHPASPNLHADYNAFVAGIMDGINNKYSQKLLDLRDAANGGPLDEVEVRKVLGKLEQEVAALRVYLQRSFLPRVFDGKKDPGPELFLSDEFSPDDFFYEDITYEEFVADSGFFDANGDVDMEEVGKWKLAIRAATDIPNHGPQLSRYQRALIFHETRGTPLDLEIARQIRVLNLATLDVEKYLKSFDGNGPGGRKMTALLAFAGTLAVLAISQGTAEASEGDREALEDVSNKALGAIKSLDGEEWLNAALFVATQIGAEVATETAITYTFGAPGALLYAAFDVVQGYVALREMLHAYVAQFPDADKLRDISEAVDSVGNFVADLMREYKPSGTEMLFAEGLVSAQGGDENSIAFASGAANLDGNGGNDLLVSFGNGTLDGGAGRDLLVSVGDANLNGGEGNDAFVSLGTSKINMGSGDDFLIHAGNGSVVTSGSGKDTFAYTDGILITDANGDDTLTYYSVELQTAIAWGGADSDWALFGGVPIVRAGFNGAGELVVQDVISYIRQVINSIFGQEPDASYFMYFAGGNHDPNAAPSERTAGIRLLALSFETWQLMDFPSGTRSLSENNAMWQFMAEYYKERMAAANGIEEQDVDPLVLDLDGDGLELTARSSISPRFDVDGDLYAEVTGWVGADDGFLAVDLNANGKVDGLNELFGTPTANGFTILKNYDSNGDKIVDATDAKFSDLRIWQDLDGDAVTDAGELKTLTEAGIASISTDFTEVSKTNATNRIAGEATFTKTNGTTSTISDVRFNADQYNTTYTGDKTIDPTIAATQPKLKGHGTLADLQVVLTLEQAANQGQPGSLAQAIATTLPTLNVVDLAELRNRSLPILQAWAAMSPTTGSWQWNNPSVAILVDRSENAVEVVDFAIQVIEQVPLPGGGTTNVTYWKRASGADTHDAQGNVIQYPTREQVMAEQPLDPDQSWDLMTGGTIRFIERFFGVNIPLEDMDILQHATIAPMSALLSKAEGIIELLAVRLAMQGPLASYFEGITYDVTRDAFLPTTDRQLAPMFEAIFEDAPGSAQGAKDWLESWEPIVDTVITDYKRGKPTLINSYAFIFTGIVAAYENVGLAIDVKQAAVALGLPENQINVGTGDRAGTSSNDIFYLGAGNDTVKGGAGPDTYVVGRNFGSDVIDDLEPGAADFDQLRFAHLKEDEVTAYRDGKDLIIVVNGTGDTLTVKEHFYDILPSLFGGNTAPDRGVEEIVFGDGKVWDRTTIALKVSHPLDGDDSLTGTDQVDVLDGGKGNDTMSGGNNADVYIFGKTYGKDLIQDSLDNILVSDHDFVMFHSEIGRNDVIFTRNGNSDDLVIKINGTDDTLTIKNQFEATYTGPFGTQWFNRVETFSFNEDRSIEWDDVMRTIVANGKTDGDDAIYGFSFEDDIDGGKGNDTLSGGNENDIYRFGKGYGQDVINENLDNILSGQSDRVIFGSGVKAGDVEFSRIGNSNDLIVTLSDGSKLTVNGQFNATHTGPFGTQWFDRIEYFDFSTGDPSLNAWQVMDRIIANNQTSGDDTVYGFDRADTLNGGAGNDYLAGGNDSDTYIFEIGSGQDVVEDDNDNILVPDEDVIKFGSGIKLEDVTFTRDGEDVIVSVKNSTDALRVDGQLTRYPLNINLTGVESFQFADGTVLSEAQVRAKVIQSQQTDGDDTVRGTDFDDVIQGGKGNDRLEGNGGGDTYMFGLGDGQDVITDTINNIWFDQSDTLLLGSGITLDNIIVNRQGTNLILSTDVSEDKVTVLSYFSDAHLIEQIKFADGTSWGLTDVTAMFLTGTAGDDQITGFFTSDEITGGKGNDTLAGGDRSDTYVYARGDGHDTINEGAHSSGSVGRADKLVFTDIDPADVTLVRNGHTVTLVIAESAPGAGDGGSIVLTNGLSTFWYTGVESVVFANGTSWSQSDIRQLLLDQESTPGNDTVTGFNAADTITAGAGDDTISGGDDSDTYVYARGDGNDTIIEAGHSGGETGKNDKLVFTDINAADVSLVRSGNSVTLVVAESAPGAGNGGSVLLQNDLTDVFWEGVETVQFANGQTWNQWQIREMLLAQASTAGNDTIAGFNTADTITGGDGNDAMSGGDGSDTYVYARGDGKDTIIESYDSLGRSGKSDKLVFSDINASDVSLTRSGNDVTIVIAESSPGAGDGGSILLKEGLSTFYYTGVEQIVFANGTVWTQATLRSMLVDSAGTPGDDVINGFTTNDVIEGGKGNDTLAGKDGSDTYIYARGDGHDTITEDAHSSGQTGKSDQLVFTDINASEVSLVRNGQTVTLVIAESAPGAGDGGSIVLNTGLSDFFYRGVEYVVFADGTTWTKQVMREMLLAAVSTDGDDTIVGFTANDVITGGKGNDTLDGADEADTYIYNRGDGHDTILDTVSGGSDKLFLHGVKTSEVTLGRSGNTAILNIAESAPGAGDDGSIAMSTAYHSLLSEGVDQVIFDDGTIWTQPMLRNLWLDQMSTEGNDQITGFSDPDNINAGDGDDTVDGGDGGDTIAGGAGNDNIGGGDSNDTYIFARGDGNDTIWDATPFYGSGDKLILTGLNVSDISLSRNGNDATLIVHESAPGADDGGSVTLFSSFVISQQRGVEQVKFADGTIWGAAELRSAWLAQMKTGGDDNIAGFSTNETVDGGAGNDTLTGGGGNDTLIGGAGNDTFMMDTDDNIVENAGEGTDTVQISASKALGANFENLTLLGTAGYSGDGNELDNAITGNSGANALTGAAGNDTLDGGTGADNLKGGAGDDLYFVDNAGDVITESTGDGTDQVKVSASYTLAAGVEVEVLILTGSGSIDVTGNELANVINGNGGANKLNGGTGADTLSGGAGDDKYYVDDAKDVTIENADEGIDEVQASVTYSLADNIEKLTMTGASAIDGTGNALDNTLTGNASANALLGGAGNDVLDGAAGDDALTGGLGDDVYVVDSANDAINELSGAGDDLVKSVVTLTSLAANVERLTLTGSAAISGVGNELDNVLTGNSGANNLAAGDGNDMLDGSAGNDTLSGGNGNDQLTGGTGNDSMSGGAGDDFYYVDSTNDSVTESAGEGYDTVQALASFTIKDNVESLILSGIGNISGTGSAGNNLITGNSGANTLNGGVGADTLIGGLGNDVYIVDDVFDQTNESANEGTDTVQTGITWNTLADNVENLTLTGSNAVNATGNALDNLLMGNGAGNVMSGGDGNDTILSSDGNDSISGGDGDDWLDGNLGTDTLNGGAGNDTADYRYVSSTAWSFDLAANTASGESMVSIEHLYAGGGGDTINGSSVANLLNGGGGSDTINGLVGDDTLIGGNGNDKLSGGDGNDWIEGSSGNDSYTGGAGDDWLVADVGTDSFDGGDGIDTVDFRYLTTAGTIDLVSNPGEVITAVENVYSGSGADTLSGSAVANYINGGDGNDTIVGREGDDTLEGGAGNDTLTGGTGADLYKMGRGDGADVIAVSASDGNADKLQFGLTVAYDQLWLSKSSSDLVISIIGTNDKMTVEGWYGAGNDQVDRIETNDGFYLLTSDVDALVGAMASLTPPPLGQTTLTAQQQQQLAPALAASWHQAA